MENKKGREKRLKSARVIEVIEIKLAKGEGTEANPVRLATQYWALNGEFLFEKDK
mgnify:CR=1 FL=1|nr:MAG TPA: hypothetical protein [Caudoviricetes sp.]